MRLLTMNDCKQLWLELRWSCCVILLVTPTLIHAAPAANILTPRSHDSSSSVKPNRSRLTTVDWESYHEHEHEGPGTYAFAYDIQDGSNVQFREESRDANGVVRGSYGLIEPDGNIRVVHYIADEKGFRVEIENTLRPDQQFPPKLNRDNVPLIPRVLTPFFE